MSAQKIFLKIVIWLAAEIILSLLNLDNLADYSEFLWEKQLLAIASQTAIVVI